MKIVNPKGTVVVQFDVKEWATVKQALYRLAEMSIKDAMHTKALYEHHQRASEMVASLKQAAC